MKRNKTKYFKIMFSVENSDIIFDALNEFSLDQIAPHYRELKKHINYSEWYDDYCKLFRQYLNGKSTLIFDLHSEINVRMIEAIKKLNKDLEKERVMFLYGIDFDYARDLYHNFIKEYEDKIELFVENPYMNAYVLESECLFLPDLS
jgi:hypothetical protein